MTRRNTPREPAPAPVASHAWGVNPVTSQATDYDAVLAMYEPTALKLMLRCLLRQFHAGETIQAVRTAQTLLKTLPPVRRGNIWIDNLEAADERAGDDMTSMTPEEQDAFILEPYLTALEDLTEAGAGDEAGEARGLAST